MKVEPTDALIVVDVQNDFLPGGALAVEDGDAVIPVINRIVPRFRQTVFTRDWHPENHCSFSDDPQFVDRSWPRHCVRETPGAEFAPELNVPEDAWIVSKATHPDREAYSDFEGTGLGDDLRNRGIRRLFVCGLATDYCVRATALDGLREGFEVFVVTDAVRGVDVPPGSAAAALREMEQAGATLCTSGDIE